MKKNLRNVLVLALGLITTIASAQWSVDSRTRINNTDPDLKTGDMRTVLAGDWSTSDVNLHVGLDHTYAIGTGVNTVDIYEVYAATDLMGYATVTMGTRAMDFGSGSLISSNQWSNDPTTQQGIDIAVNNSFVDLNVGLMGGLQQDNNTQYINASKSGDNYTVNVLMLSNDLNSTKAHGYDFAYSMMDGQLVLNASMNSDYQGDEMTSYGASYNVFDNMTVSINRQTNGEEGMGDFDMAGTDYDGSWDATGNLGYLDNQEENTSVGVSYDLGDVSFSYTQHTITDVSANSLGNERKASDMKITYNLNDNSTISWRKISDDATEDVNNTPLDLTDDVKIERTWITLSMGL
jgi:hypothetical protein